MIFVGVDWAEARPEVLVEDEDGKRLDSGTKRVVLARFVRNLRLADAN